MTEPLLAGIRVLDLSQYLPGPMAGQLLADLGAEVVKVEPPAGDPMRAVGPADGDGLSAWYKLLNAGKTVVRLDLKDAQGRARLGELIARADVLLESYRPGVLARVGFGPDSLRTLKPDLVHCALSGFGQTGPLSQVGGHDINYMALGGGLAWSGTAAAPVQAYPPAADHASAPQAALAILAALLRRGRSGQGASLDISLTETVLAWQALPLTAALRPGEGQTRGRGLLNGGAAFYGLYRTADGRFVSLGALEPKFWANFCSAVGRPDLVARQDEPFPQQALIDEVAAIFAAQPLAAWIELLGQVDCCFQPVVEPQELLDHPQVEARGQLRVEAGEAASVEVLFGGWIDGQPPAERAPLHETSADRVIVAWGEAVAQSSPR